jgi:hypothetical protein
MNLEPRMRDNSEKDTTTSVQPPGCNSLGARISGRQGLFFALPGQNDGRLAIRPRRRYL